ncbi:DUF6879 family protein [Nocardia mexicana]|uniref:DUF6879 domain-containing protein n=1 Tax=Nocardia mexicana TaxID=279262 RepID=A0A370HAN4_9NOCA|nr:DUF6879 family protein [Nocardia mexicana]RDI53998.1 hypothetical protein DFR68_102119 [Nocardia mexicana]
MKLIQGEEFVDLFRGGEWKRAFHLETQDEYLVADEHEPFRKFLAGEPDDYEWCRSWDDLIRDVTGSGKQVHRVRLVSIPHVDYTRFGLTIAPLNIEAGEEIKWLPRPLIDPAELTQDDYWLFDDDLVVFVTFRSDGDFGGFAVTDDPVIAAHCTAIRDKVWGLGIPHADYVGSDYAAAK